MMANMVSSNQTPLFLHNHHHLHPSTAASTAHFRRPNSTHLHHYLSAGVSSSKNNLLDTVKMARVVQVSSRKRKKMLLVHVFDLESDAPMTLSMMEVLGLVAVLSFIMVIMC